MAFPIKKILPSGQVQARRKLPHMPMHMHIAHAYACMPTSGSSWTGPDEFLLLGVAADVIDAGSSPSPESDTSTTSETATTEQTDETDDDDDDAWPLEMLVG